MAPPGTNDDPPDLSSEESASEQDVSATVHPFSEDEHVPEEKLPIRAAHLEQFQKMSFRIVAGLIGVVALATLLVAAISPPAASVASEVAKIALPALIALLGTAITWAFKSGP